MAKFSTALHYVKELTQMTYAAYFNEALQVEGRGGAAAAAQGGAEDGAAASPDAGGGRPGGAVGADGAGRVVESTSRSTGRPSSSRRALSAAGEDAVVRRLLSLDARFLPREAPAACRRLRAPARRPRVGAARRHRRRRRPRRRRAAAAADGPTWWWWGAASRG